MQLWEVLRVFRFDSLSELRLLENLRTVALVMQRERDDEPEDSESGGDTEMRLAAAAGERRDSLFYVENLRKTLEAGVRSHWGGGVPTVQLWFW